jgi:hypothetical protein
LAGQAWLIWGLRLHRCELQVILLVSRFCANMLPHLRRMVKLAQGHPLEHPSLDALL